jgi:hypothetical protein
MAAIKATTKRAALIFIVSSPSQIGVGHPKKWVGHDLPVSTRIQKLKLALGEKKTMAWREGVRIP